MPTQTTVLGCQKTQRDAATTEPIMKSVFAPTVLGDFCHPFREPKCNHGLSAELWIL